MALSIAVSEKKLYENYLQVSNLLVLFYSEWITSFSFHSLFCPTGSFCFRTCTCINNYLNRFLHCCFSLGLLHIRLHSRYDTLSLRSS